MLPLLLDGSPRRKGHSGVAFVLVLSALIMLNSLSQAADEGAPKAIRRSSPQIGVAMKDEKRVALVVGNGAYSVGPLQNPAHDAEDLSGVLRKLGACRVTSHRDEIVLPTFSQCDRLHKDRLLRV